MKKWTSCVRELGSDYAIKKRISEGSLFRIEKGIYSENKDIPEIAIISCKYKKAVLTMRSAFYIHGLTDVIPDKYDLATGRNSAKIHDNRIRQYFVPESFFCIGISTVKHKEYEISIYSKERMLIELIRYFSKLPYDYYKEIILRYRSIMPSLNVQDIQEYAMAAPNSGKIIRVLQSEVF